VKNTYIKQMKTQTAFRLEKSLLDALKEEAKKQNRSLNNYVEFVLSKIIEKSPNKTTQQAIEEARNNEDLETIKNVKSLLNSL
jgi:hypothetical protein